MEALGLSPADAGTLAGDRSTGDFYERAIAAGGEAKRVANLILSHGRRLSNERSVALDRVGVSAERFAEVARLIDQNKIAASAAGALFDRLMELDSPAEQVASELGLMLGFHTTPGSGGRERAPLPTWLEVTKLQTLAAKQVAKELHLRSVWSWGWGVYSVAEDDPDKATAACVYLWTRNSKLCKGPKAAGPTFNTSRTQGQLILPRGARCTVLGKPVTSVAIRDLTPVTGDADVAFTSVFARVVAGLHQPLKSTQVLNAEKAVVLSRFGSYAAYRAALARAHASPLAARGVIADELRRALIQRRMTVGNPSDSDVQAYYATYADANARLVETKVAAPWLAGRKRGYALESNAPRQLFSMPGGKWSRSCRIRSLTRWATSSAFEPGSW